MRILAAGLMVTLHSAQALEPRSSGELQLALEKLNVLGSVLYVAAHPDDENTKLITYLANEAKVRTTYLSLTRGDGGQNLLGSDLSEKLGIIRTQELLRAREIDGGGQLFSRANDFGFSKTAEESLRIWGREAILSDMVRAIRSTRPDVIVTRFSPEPGFTHGHHTAATLLAQDAFEAAADPAAFPEQMDRVEPWQAKRLFWNTSNWYYRLRNIPFDPTGLLAIDTGVYSPLLGASYPEIAAKSRSAHKTQGFGATPELGQAMEYFIPIDGKPTSDSLFTGIDMTWDRVPDSAPVAEAIRAAIAAFSPDDPSLAVPDLIEAHKALSQLPDSFWRTQKLHDLEKVIAGCLGIDVESLSSQPTAVAGDEITLTLNAIQRSPLPVQIEFFAPDGSAIPPDKGLQHLGSNELLQIQQGYRLPEDLEISQPYWLREASELGRYTVSDPSLIGVPENPPALPIGVRLVVDDYPLRFTIPTTFNRNDPVNGELKEPFVITPPAMVNLSESTEIFANSEPRKFTARVIAKSEISDAQLRFLTKDGWQVEPESISFDATAGEEISFEATLIPPKQAGQSILAAELLIDGETYRRGFERIEYDHIPVQTLFPMAEARVVVLDVQTAGERIGYIPGAGDEIPEALRRMGYLVDDLTEADMQAENLARFDAIVVGIRAVNTNDRIGFYLPPLFEYAKGGGVVILQYNTNGNLKSETFSPLSLTLSRDRVTDETAEMRVLAPDHPVMNFPNRITAADFDDWVQERGLYFASEWDSAFTPIFSANDQGEEATEGGLLIARYGSGWFVYTGLSWFRQLPAGVPGAYRIFANLVSLGHAE